MRVILEKYSSVLGFISMVLFTADNTDMICACVVWHFCIMRPRGETKRAWLFVYADDGSCAVIFSQCYTHSLYKPCIVKGSFVFDAR